MENLEEREFGFRKISEICNGDLDEIYAYFYVEDIETLMHEVFSMKFKPQWIRVEKVRVYPEVKYEVRLSYETLHKFTLFLDTTEGDKFVKMFEENISNSPLAKYNLKFQLFYADNGGCNKNLEETAIIREASLAAVSSVGNDDVDIHYSGNKGLWIDVINDHNYTEFLNRILFEDDN